MGLEAITAIIKSEVIGSNPIRGTILTDKHYDNNRRRLEAYIWS